ncbi:MAG: high-affinity nickel-transport family protein [Candidatus Rokubacteria bacterium]|nr:high-affinity nickel-transport family protein [Candidatus Rokubacteria bacterium]
MDGALSVVLLGLLLGVQHATDPDHVAAVATIVSRRPRFSSGALIGAFWGIGHTLTIVGVGGAIILLNLTISHTVGLSLELAVAVMLVLLGSLRLVWTFKGRDHVRPEHLQAAHDHAAGPAFHSHPHAHDGVTHSHPHLHPSRRMLDALQSVGAPQVLRSVGIGIVHGLAGSAAVALLVLSTIKNPYWATAYLLVFGAGTILGMMAITAAMTVPFTLTARRFAWLNRSLAFGTGAVSLCLGVFLIYQIGFVERLFTG